MGVNLEVQKHLAWSAVHLLFYLETECQAMAQDVGLLAFLPVCLSLRVSVHLPACQCQILTVYVCLLACLPDCLPVCLPLPACLYATMPTFIGHEVYSGRKDES